MADRKKKKKRKISPEIQILLGRSSAELLDRLAGQEPAELFASCCAGLKGYEADLIETLAMTRRVDVLNFLHRLIPSLKDKATLKATKRAIYRLEQAGLTADPGARQQGGSILKPSAPREASGFLGAYDPSGCRVCVLTIPAQSTGFAVGLFITSQGEGLVEFHNLFLKSGEIRSFIRELEGNSPTALVEMPAETVRFVLTEAAATTLAVGRVLPEDYQAYIMVASGLAVPEKPGIYNFLSAEEVSSSEDLEHAVFNLLANDFLRGFILTEDLAPYIEKLQEVESSVLILTDVQKNQRRMDIIEKALAETYDAESKRRVKRQLEETALLLWYSGEEELARVALASALDLDREAGPLTPHPFLRGLVMFSLDITTAMAEKLGRDSEESDDGVKSESGLILP